MLVLLLLLLSAGFIHAVHCADQSTGQCDYTPPQVPDAVRFSVTPVELHAPNVQLPATTHEATIAAHVHAGMNDQQLKVLSTV
jgi:hypothetical protein